MKLAPFIRAIDHPDSRKIHSRAIPRTGGLAMAIALTLVFLSFFPLNQTVLAFVLGLVIVVATGLADDIWQIRPWMKFVGETLAATG